MPAAFMGLILSSGVSWAGSPPPPTAVLLDLFGGQSKSDNTTSDFDTQTLICSVQGDQMKVKFYVVGYTAAYNWSIDLGESAVASGVLNWTNAWSVTLDDLDPYPAAPRRYTLRITQTGSSFKRTIEFVPLKPTDTLLDYDGDGWTNLQEINARTDMWAVDTDGDGLIDSEDPDPLVAEVFFNTTSAFQVLSPLD